MNHTHSPPLSGVYPAAWSGQVVPDQVDNIIQTLFAASMVAEGLSATFQQSSSPALQGLDDLHRLIRRALEEAYSLQLELRPGATGQAPGRDNAPPRRR